MLFGVILLGALGVFWYRFIREEPLPPSELLPPPRDVQIDFTVFQTPAFLELGDPRPPIPVLLPDEIGKPNPFAPQGGGKEATR